MARIGGTVLSMMLWMLLLSQPSEAGSFGVAPTGLELSTSERIQVLTLHNQGDAPALMQVRVVAWSQRDGEDSFQETRDVIVAPPVFTLPAGSDQVIRVALRRGPDALHEASYRVFVQEVPGALPFTGNGLRVALQLSIPVFVRPMRAAGPPEIQWAAHRSEDRLRIAALNAGNVHLQVQRFELGIDGATVPVTTTRYILPGSEISWLTTVPAPAKLDRPLEIRGVSNLGEFTANAALAPP